MSGGKICLSLCAGANEYHLLYISTSQNKGSIKRISDMFNLHELFIFTVFVNTDNIYYIYIHLHLHYALLFLSRCQN